MVDVKPAVDWLLAQAPPPRADLAERAIRTGERRRRIRRIVVPIAGVAAVAMTMAIVLMVAVLRSGTDDFASSPKDDTWLINLPPETPVPKALPNGRGVGKVDIAFRQRCRGKEKSELKACAGWWLWRADGTSWRLTDVKYFKDPEYLFSPVILSPRGDRLAYIRESDSATVVRDLTTGKVRVVARPGSGSTTPQGWSTNGRWLVLDGTIPGKAGAQPKVKVVDTTNLRARELPVAGRVQGVPDTGDPIPILADDRLIHLVYANGKTRKVSSLGDESYEFTISPDAKLLAGIATVQNKLGVQVIDVVTGKRVDEFTIDAETVGMLRWDIPWVSNRMALSAGASSPEDADFEITDALYLIDLRKRTAELRVHFVGNSRPAGIASFSIASARLAK